MALKEFTQKDSQSCDVINTENEYESLDKYNGEYEEIQFPSKQITGSVQQKRSQTGNYNVTQCPAYLPITRKVPIVSKPATTSESSQLNIGASVEMGGK